MRHIRVLTAALCFAPLACGSHEATLPVEPSDLSSVQQTVDINGRQLILAPYLWRDFQPIAPPDGRPLIAVLRVQANDKSLAPPNVTVDAAWVVFGDDVWAATVGEAKTYTNPPTYEVVARNGPKWGPDVTVDVIVRVREPHGAAFLLRAANQPIKRTD